MPESPFVTTGSYPTRQGNHLALLLDGEAAFERVCEQIEASTARVWATITFMWPTFHFPGGRGAPLAFLNRAAARGVDVRLLFWRPDDETANLRTNAFWGAPEHLEQLQPLHANISVRWDRAAPGYCQHQKSWLIDGGTRPPVAFVGGLNLNPHSLARPGHRGPGQNHDLYVELRGPAVADVEHNFVQRWNEASEQKGSAGGWGSKAKDKLDFPGVFPEPCGDAAVQIQRTIPAQRYHRGHAPVGGHAYEIAAGERTIIAQYCRAMRLAQRTIYLENQYIEVPEIVEALHGALQRGVEVVAVLPAQPDLSPYRSASPLPERQAFLESRAALGQSAQFTLSGLAGQDELGGRHPVWIHSKLLLIDDEWGTVGSANLHRFSAYGNGEMNVTFHDPATARAFRIELFAEHLALNTADLDDVAALRTFQRTALDNRARLERGETQWQGIAVGLDIASYGSEKTIDFD